MSSFLNYHEWNRTQEGPLIGLVPKENLKISLLTRVEQKFYHYNLMKAKRAIIIVQKPKSVFSISIILNETSVLRLV